MKIQLLGHYIRTNTTIKGFSHHCVKSVKLTVIFDERGVPHILFHGIGLEYQNTT